MSPTPARNMLGAYGPWAAARNEAAALPLSFRNASWTDLAAWKEKARAAADGLLLSPTGARAADVQVHSRQVHDGLVVEELSWQLPYGPRTEAVFLKPESARGRLPAILGLHDHAGIKHFGKRKIVRAGRKVHPLMQRHHEEYYSGLGWADEAARRGFAVLVHDVFPFESRRIRAGDLPGYVVDRLVSPPDQVRELTPEDLASTTGGTCDVPPGEPSDRVAAYNTFAAQHESVVAKSLFCAGLTWPGVMVADDRAALDYLASRPDVDPERMGCGGLSGGGLRTVFLAGLEERVRCAVCAGAMTTFRDFLLNVSYTHTWMIYVPGLPNLMDFPEILAMRAPLPTMILATTEDPLYTRAETERAGRILEETYGKAGAPDALRVHFHQGPHKFDRPMQEQAFAWWERWLR
ncbi:MAG TPA: prolyl oligopeptidase family serine peptidase [Spirochaetia bacterium]|nr:prolyl oligopeptidase family serine peptidase [Spirochaetia bacterium]